RHARLLEVPTPEPDTEAEQFLLTRRERLAADLPLGPGVGQVLVLVRRRVEEQLLREHDQRVLLHRPLALVSAARVAGRRDDRAERRVRHEQRDREDRVLPGYPPFVDRVAGQLRQREVIVDRKSTRLNSSHVKISYAV